MTVLCSSTLQWFYPDASCIFTRIELFTIAYLVILPLTFLYKNKKIDRYVRSHENNHIYLYVYYARTRRTCIDVRDSALESGAGTALDSLDTCFESFCLLLVSFFLVDERKLGRVSVHSGI